MRSWLFFLVLGVSLSQEYVCNLANFRRSVGSVQLKVEAYYSKVVTSAAEIAETLTYSSAHPKYFPGVYQVSDLAPCNDTRDQFSLNVTHPLLGIHVLNKTASGIDFKLSLIEKELDFITPIANFLPTVLSHNNDTTTIYVAGIALNCSSFYFYPYRNLCGNFRAPLDLCSDFNLRYNMFTKVSELESDFEQGGHWSYPLPDGKGGLSLAFSLPVKNAAGVFTAQLGIGVGSGGMVEMIHASRPSVHGYNLIMNGLGHVIYAEQAAINLLFGAGANLTLAKLINSYSGQLENHGISLREYPTPFQHLPQRLVEETNGSELFYVNEGDSNDGYYAAWSRFDTTLQSWFMVGILPRGDLDNAAVWSVSPPSVEITLTDDNPSTKVTILVENQGLLPLSFSVGSNPHARGIYINSTAARYYLNPSSTVKVDFIVQMERDKTDAASFTTHFVTPFYSGTSGYGVCFQPLTAEMVINVIRQQFYVPSRWATTIIWLLCGITAPLVLGELIALICYRYSPPVLALAPRVCFFQLFGMLFVLGASAINQLVPTVPVCQLTFWLLHVGFTMSVSAIAAKNFRNRLIFTSKKLQVVALSDYTLLGFVAACLVVDVILLVIGTVKEPYRIAVEGQCELSSWITYWLLLATKIILWFGAFWNTLKIANIPSTFADTRLNGVLAIIALLAVVRLGLQFFDAFGEHVGIELFLGSLFMWFSVFLVWGHFLLKLRAGYVAIARPRSSTKNASISLSLTQPKLKERLEILLIEIEAQSKKLLKEKNAAVEAVKANQRLMFEVRAELLAINTQAHLVDEELERFLPVSIKSAFDKFGPAIARRMDVSRPATNKPRAHPTIEAGTPEAAEARQLLSAESPTGSTPTPAFNSTPSTATRNRVQERAHLDSDDMSNPSNPKSRRDEDHSRPAIFHFPHQSLKETRCNEDVQEDQDQGEASDEASSTQEEDTPLQREHRS